MKETKQQILPERLQEAALLTRRWSSETDFGLLTSRTVKILNLCFFKETKFVIAAREN